MTEDLKHTNGSKVAAEAGSPCIILQKERHKDRDADITVPNIPGFKNRTPALVDDIISIAHTTIETSKHWTNLASRLQFALESIQYFLIHPIMSYWRKQS